jgi:hypothetical protein
MLWCKHLRLIVPRFLEELAVITQDYRSNRSRFPQAELACYRGRWVAFSADGCRVVGSGDTVEELEEQLAKSTQDPQRVVLEWLAGPEDDSLVPGGDLV